MRFKRINRIGNTTAHVAKKRRPEGGLPKMMKRGEILLAEFQVSPSWLGEIEKCINFLGARARVQRAARDTGEDTRAGNPELRERETA